MLCYKQATNLPLDGTPLAFTDGGLLSDRPCVRRDVATGESLEAHRSLPTTGGFHLMATGVVIGGLSAGHLIVSSQITLTLP